MDIRNCRNCGNIFNYMSGPIVCPACKESLEAKFQEVKQYIEEHPGVGIKQVSDACDVETSQIQQWLREERLEVTENSAIYLNCESCGAPIRSGRFCDRCRNNLTNGFKNIIRSSQPVQEAEKKKPDDKNKMRFLQN